MSEYQQIFRYQQEVIIFLFVVGKASIFTYMRIHDPISKARLISTRARKKGGAHNTEPGKVTHPCHTWRKKMLRKNKLFLFIVFHDAKKTQNMIIDVSATERIRMY